ncbi:MAG: hypothetical protein HY617_03820 [Candidatus Sungbacteria bacterium]|nr:hypothetical protein [Candidatus Sungbacteria bacterium]
MNLEILRQATLGPSSSRGQDKPCQNCSKPFTIEPEDFAFYEKIKVPAPTFCPKCRRQRRMAWRNDFNFYSRTCDLCKKQIVSLYAPDKRFPVYCNKCWWSDQWDAKDYAADFNFSRPFFEQFVELQNRVPALALINDDGIGSVNCQYTHDFSFGRNCYMVLLAWKLEDSLYGHEVIKAKEVVDAMSSFGDCELSYESICTQQCYRSTNIYYSFSVKDMHFCYDCRDSSDCFLSIGLRHKRFYVKNKQYSEEEYKRIIAEYRLDTHNGRERAKKEFGEFIMKYPRRYANLKNCVASIGDDLINSKNCHYVFNAFNAEDSKYFENGEASKDSYDILVAGEINQCYEALTPDQSYRNFFSFYSWKNMEVTYCDSCHSSKYLFGCVGLKKGEYCIFNKQYSKEEYEKLKNRIIEHMKTTGEWGEFFPARLSRFGYNETVAQMYHPLAEEDAHAKDFQWRDSLQLTTGKETIALSDLPDSIRNISDSITNEILVCGACSRNYRIIPQELAFYRKMSLPIPRRCFLCRNAARLAFRNPFELWHRFCQCAGKSSANGVYQNQTGHAHGDAPCSNEFQTSYAPDRPEIVYCEQCYQSEVV